LEYLTLRLPGEHHRRVTVARPVGDAMARVWLAQQDVLILLTAVGVLMVLMGSAFMNRTIVLPLRKVVERLRERREESGRGLTAQDDLSELRYAIIDMTQTIEEDREHIKTQLSSLRVAHGELESANKQLARAARLAVVGQLAAGLAHEVGNPLAVLSGYVEVLQAGDVAESERPKVFTRMGRELERIQATLRELLDFSRAPAQDAGRGDVGDALQHVQALLQPQEGFKELDFTVELAADLPKVSVDTDKLTQIMLNLLFNARDAVKRDGVIRVVASLIDGRVHIVVEDNGPGISDEALPRIFEPFFTTKEPGSGTGLGLAVCERIVANAGGDIVLERSELGGARFDISLPSR